MSEPFVTKADTLSDLESRPCPTFSTSSSSWRPSRARPERSAPSPTMCWPSSGRSGSGPGGRRGRGASRRPRATSSRGCPGRTERRDADPPLRPPRHRAPGRGDRAGGRRRRRPKRGRDDPRRRQQGCGRGHAGGRPAHPVPRARPHAGLELVFTPKEEVGLLGAQEVDTTALAAHVGFVYDHAGPIGEVVSGAPSATPSTRSSAAAPPTPACTPEEGRSAIYAAARAIADLRLGRVDAETTANVGGIGAGARATSSRTAAWSTAEARSHDERKLAELVQEMVDSFAFAAALTVRGRRHPRGALPGVSSSDRTMPGSGWPSAAPAGLVLADPRRRRRGCERLQRAGTSVRQPRQRDGPDPQRGRAHRGRRPRGHGRGHATSSRPRGA